MSNKLTTYVKKKKEKKKKKREIKKNSKFTLIDV